MLDDNNIKNRFNNSDWENEDWLQPDDFVFENISEEVFKEKEPKKKRFLWLFLGLMLIPLVTYQVYFNSKSENLPLNLDKGLQLSESGSIESEYKEIKVISESDPKTIVNNSTRDSKIKDDASSSNNGIFKSTKIKTSLNRQTAKSNIKPLATLNDKDLSELDHNENLPLNKTEVSDGFLGKQGFTTLSSLKVSKKIVTTLDQIDLIPMSQVFSSNLVRNINPTNSPSAVSLKPDFKKSKFSWSYGLGLSIWDLDLNNAYREALELADYKQVLGKGALVELGLDMALNDRWSLRSRLAYERIYLSSGHNSNFIYDRADESASANNSTSLTMASPLGFISAPITIERDIDQSQQSMYQLVLDLDNKHVINNIDLALSLEYKLIKRSDFESGINAGFGIQRIVSLENNLESVQTNHEDFKAVKSNEVSEQQNYSKTRPYLNLGCALNKSLDERHELSFNYGYHRDLKQIFKSGDFAADLQRHHISVGVRTFFSR